jgi:hypothetical protein
VLIFFPLKIYFIDSFIVTDFKSDVNTNKQNKTLFLI